MKKVIFIGLEYKDLQAEIDEINKYSKKKEWDVLAVVTDYKAQQYCEKNNIKFKTTIDYLTPKRHYNAALAALNFTKSWYKKPEIEKIFSHDGNSFCQMMEYDFYMIFAGFFIDVELYKGIIENEKPDKIILVKRVPTKGEIKNLTNMKGYDSFIMQSLIKNGKISVEYVEPIIDSFKEPTIKKSSFDKILFYINTIKKQTESLKYKHSSKEIFYKIEIAWNYIINRWFKEHIIKDFSKRKRKIAFAGTTRVAKNITDLLKKDRENGVICLKMPNSKETPLIDIPVIDLNYFKTQKIENIVSDSKNKFVDGSHNENILNYFEKEFVYDKVNFWEPMKLKLEFIFEEYMPFMVLSMELTKEMVDKVGLDILLSSSDRNPIIISVIRTLQSRNKKSLVYLHGIDYFDIETSKIYGQTLIPINADKIATWGDAAKEWFIRQGVSADRVVSTSCSDFDDYIPIFNYSKESLKRKLKINNSRVVLYAVDHGNKDTIHPYHGETRDEIIKHLKEVIDVVGNIKNTCLIVRPHPGDKNKTEIKEIAENSGKNNILFNPAMPLPYLLKITDLLFVYTSSTGLESMIFDANVIVYNTNGRPEPVPYSKEKAATKVTKKEDLLKTVTDMLENDDARKKASEYRKKFVRYCAGSIDGNATQNIVKLIYEITKT